MATHSRMAQQMKVYLKNTKRFHLDSCIIPLNDKYALKAPLTMPNTIMLHNKIRRDIDVFGNCENVQINTRKEHLVAYQLQMIMSWQSERQCSTAHRSNDAHLVTIKNIKFVHKLLLLFFFSPNERNEAPKWRYLQQE